MAIYCNRVCSGLGRRVNKSAEQRKAEKAEYDRARRAELGEELLRQKAAARRALLAANPELVRAREKANRDARKAEHAEYCRRPEYRDWKRNYDRKHRANKFFGPFAEAFLVLRDLESELAGRASKYERYAANGTLNKTQKRKRAYEQGTHCG